MRVQGDSRGFQWSPSILGPAGTRSVLPDEPPLVVALQVLRGVLPAAAPVLVRQSAAAVFVLVVAVVSIIGLPTVLFLALPTVSFIGLLAIVPLLLAVSVLLLSGPVLWVLYLLPPLVSALLLLSLFLLVSARFLLPGFTFPFPGFRIKTLGVLTPRLVV